MRRLPAILVLVGFGLVVSVAVSKDPKSLDVPAETVAMAKALIAKLDHEDILVRGKTMTELKAMGRHALPALVKAKGEKLPQRVLDRVLEVLPAARQADFEARTPLFLADKERKYDHDLLGWNELKAAVKDTKESRELMADILRDEECREMLLLALDTTEEGQKRFEKRWEAKWGEWWVAFRAGQQPSGHQPKAEAPLHWIVATMLAETLYDRDYRSDFRGPVLEAYSTTDEGKLSCVGTGKYAAVFRDYTRHWVVSQKQRFGLMTATWVARAWKFEKSDVIRCVEREFEAAVSRGDPPVALSQLAGTKDPKYIGLFRTVFDSETPLFQTVDGIRPEIQVRDAALAMCIALSGQDPVDFGFSSQSKAKTDNVQYSTQSFFFQFDDKQTVDEKRKAAFAKWGEWEKANPDKIKAKAPDKK